MQALDQKREREWSDIMQTITIGIPKSCGMNLEIDIFDLTEMLRCESSKNVHSTFLTIFYIISKLM